MKWRYAITYGNMKPDATAEQLVKDFAKYKSEIEKHGVKLVFWGHPFGVSENVVAVLDFGENMENYLKITSIQDPFTNSRTNFVLER